MNLNVTPVAGGSIRPRRRSLPQSERVHRPFRSPLLANRSGNSDGGYGKSASPILSPLVGSAGSGDCGRTERHSSPQTPTLVGTASSRRDAGHENTTATPNSTSSAAAGEHYDSELAELDAQILRLTECGCSEEQLPAFVDALHRYNDIKDAAQIVMGRLAELDGVTVRCVHERFDFLPPDEL